MMAAMQALGMACERLKICAKGGRGDGMRGKLVMEVLYQRPVAKTVNTSIFLLSGICNFHTDGSGRARIAKSDRQLNEPVAFQIPSTLRQRPSSQGIQLFSRGLQAKMAENSRMEYTIRLTKMQR